MQQSENTVQSPNVISMTGQRRTLWVNIETALVECHVFAQSIQQPSDRLVLGQRFRRLTGIEPAMGCNAGPTLNRNLVGRPTSSVRGTSYASIEWMLSSTGYGGGRNTRRRYIWTCLLASFLDYVLDIQDSGTWGRPIHWFFVCCIQTD